MLLVLALYEDDSHSLLYYAGIIAEPPSVRNNFRWVTYIGIWFLAWDNRYA